MRMTEQILCFSFVLISLLQVSSLHLPASWPRNITGPSRLVSCFMRPTGQDSLPVKNAPRALGFRCAHCTSEFDTRRAMDCHLQKQSSIGIGCVGFRALCDQLYNIAFPRLLGSDVPTVPASLIHVTPWTVIAGNNPPLELDAPIQATASPFLILDVPVFHHQSFGNMTF